MTRDQFIKKIVREAERRLEIPSGWWGTWRDVHGPKGRRVRFSNNGWSVSRYGQTISRHDSRTYAIKKAKELR